MRQLGAGSARGPWPSRAGVVDGRPDGLLKRLRLLRHELRILGGTGCSASLEARRAPINNLWQTATAPCGPKSSNRLTALGTPLVFLHGHPPESSSSQPWRLQILQARLPRRGLLPEEDPGLIAEVQEALVLASSRSLSARSRSSTAKSAWILARQPCDNESRFWPCWGLTPQENAFA